MKIIWLLLAFVAGGLLPVQAGLNAKMGKALSSPVHASLLSFVTGGIAIAIFLLLVKQPVNWQGAKETPWYAWLGGLLGAFYVTVIILAYPRIGPALTFGLVVLGQMLIAVLLDHFNVLVAQVHAINIWRILGVLMVIGGVVLIRKF